MNKQTAASAFTVCARASDVTVESPKVTYEGKSTFAVLCFGCWLPTPHYMDGAESVCISCGHKSNVAIRPVETHCVGRD
jgi:hypothetical protein